MAAGTRVEGSSLSGSPVPHGKMRQQSGNRTDAGEAASRTSPNELNQQYWG